MWCSIRDRWISGRSRRGKVPKRRSTWPMPAARLGDRRYPQCQRAFRGRVGRTSRNSGRVNYSMLVRLKPSAPVGYINDQLTIVTNDGGARTMTLPVEGQVRIAVECQSGFAVPGRPGAGPDGRKTVVVGQQAVPDRRHPLRGRPLHFLRSSRREQAAAFRAGRVHRRNGGLPKWLGRSPSTPIWAAS
jgi:hypothetical protein